MTLRDDLTAAADELWSDFASVMYSATYQQAGVSSYDPATGTNTVSYTDKGCSISLQSWSQQQIDTGVVKLGDRKALVRGDELGFEPSSDDRIVIDSKTWQIIDYSADPAGIVYTLHIRLIQ